MGLGVFVIANDFTALSVAIPRIEQELHTTLSRAQWVINGYALLFGVLIVTGGRLADLLGRKRMFMAGAAIFALFSLLCGVAPDVGLLIGVAGLGNTVGPLLGGWLTDVATWRLVFIVNLPVTAFAVLVTRRWVPESRPGAAEHGIDYPGVALLSAGATAILIGLDLANADGFTSPLILALLTCGVALLAVFLLAERRLGARALVPADVLRSRVFAASCSVVLLISAIYFAALLYLPQYMEVVLRYSAIRSGAGLLPLMGVYAVTSFVAGSLYGRLGPRVTVAAGAGLLAAGIFMLSFPAGKTSYLPLLPGMCVLGLGVRLFYSAVTTAAVTALGPVPVQPGRRHRLHVPDRRGRDRPGAEHRDRAQRGHAEPGHHDRVRSGPTPPWPWSASPSRWGSCAVPGRRPRTPPSRPTTGSRPGHAGRGRDQTRRDQARRDQARRGRPSLALSLCETWNRPLACHDRAGRPQWCRQPGTRTHERHETRIAAATDADRRSRPAVRADPRRPGVDHLRSPVCRGMLHGVAQRAGQARGRPGLGGAAGAVVGCARLLLALFQQGQAVRPGTG
ncbi:MAG TPA: MFS transporter [Streptosporangiaceae bacterium]